MAQQSTPPHYKNPVDHARQKIKNEDNLKKNSVNKQKYCKKFKHILMVRSKKKFKKYKTVNKNFRNEFTKKFNYYNS